MSNVFEFLLLLGRPACGKSEFIDYMTHADPAMRAARYHLGDLRIVDDFVFLWRRFEQDDEREKQGLHRLVSLPADTGYRVADDAVWDLLIDDVNESLAPQVAATPEPGRTTLVEFSRGRQAGYRPALRRLRPELLRRAAILYVEVTFEESCRRNLARYDAARRDGILTHSVPRSEMERNYLTDDWARLTSGRRQGRLGLLGTRVPFVTMNNEPESTDPVELDKRYAEALDALWALPG